MRIRALFLVLALLCPLGLVLTGCGDSNYLEAFSTGDSGDSKLERAIEALDNGQYNKAISILSGMSDSDAKRKYLSSAYLGRAGFDTLDLIAELDKAQDEAGEDAKSYLWSSAGAIFDDELKDGLISAEDAAQKLEDLDNALSVLFFGETGHDWYSLFEMVAPGRAVAGAEEEPDPTVGGTTIDKLKDARLFQAGIASALRVLLSVAAQMQFDESSIVINPQAFIEYGNYDPSELPMPSEVPTHLIEDLFVLAAAMDRMSAEKDNSLVDDFNRFLDEIGYSDDQSVSGEELSNYLNSLVGVTEARI